ncbi:MAG TPA: YueH family protein [Bacillus sp. (in: firmicutes)]|uniref:YueH family protein n=1 Tax=Bacillus litorisediminis TaxID=2922713 RepID=UPI001FAF9F04|nr:YueH family protein [Bacillus litorisediminis]HWO74927.1 YueH family protein [Bacillus sp. (in: firmicutes)]
MKIRKTMLDEKEYKIFLYENKKEYFFLAAVPDLAWSGIVRYEDSIEDVKQSVLETMKADLSEENTELLAVRIYQWTREM